ncbi:unnamed protein product [Leptosia nina]|uniref:Uncharacterized protein n=1 Tax=Leptosia nina TaxID=320188 RepID=A0AAV1J9A0_9NEOP
MLPGKMRTAPPWADVDSKGSDATERGDVTNARRRATDWRLARSARGGGLGLTRRRRSSAPAPRPAPLRPPPATH